MVFNTDSISKQLAKFSSLSVVPTDDGDRVGKTNAGFQVVGDEGAYGTKSYGVEPHFAEGIGMSK